MSENAEDNDWTRAEVYRARPGPLWYEQERDDISLVRLLNVLLRHRWKVLGLALVLATFMAGWTALQPATYTADTSIMPQTGGGGGGQLAQLSGVASQFGIDVPSGQAGQSPQFYADLLTSRRLLEQAVTASYTRSKPSASASEGHGSASAAADSAGHTLVELYRIKAPSREAAVSAAAGRLEQGVSVSANLETGVVKLSVTTPWPAVSKQVADQLINLLNRFNNRVRQSQASARASFVQERLREARGELRAAEDSLEQFLQRNVGWQQSPELRFQHDRLQRRVRLKQQVYTSLATRYEEARIAEVKSTPVVTTVTEPDVPAGPDSSRLRLKAILGLILGGMLGVFWAFGSEFQKNVQEENTEDYREFVSLKKDAAEDVRRAGRRIRRLLGSGSGEKKS